MTDIATATAFSRVRAISVAPSNRVVPKASATIAVGDPRRHDVERHRQPAAERRERQGAEQDAQDGADLRALARLVVEGEEREFRPLAGGAVEHQRPGQDVEIGAVALRRREPGEDRDRTEVDRRCEAAGADIDRGVMGDHPRSPGGRTVPRPGTGRIRSVAGR